MTTLPVNIDFIRTHQYELPNALNFKKYMTMNEVIAKKPMWEQQQVVNPLDELAAELSGSRGVQRLADQDNLEFVMNQAIDINTKIKNIIDGLPPNISDNDLKERLRTTIALAKSSGEEEQFEIAQRLTALYISGAMRQILQQKIQTANAQRVPAGLTPQNLTTSLAPVITELNNLAALTDQKFDTLQTVVNGGLQAIPQAMRIESTNIINAANQLSQAERENFVNAIAPVARTQEQIKTNMVQKNVADTMSFRNLQAQLAANQEKTGLDIGANNALISQNQQQTQQVKDSLDELKEKTNVNAMLANNSQIETENLLNAVLGDTAEIKEKQDEQLRQGESLEEIQKQIQDELRVLPSTEANIDNIKTIITEITSKAVDINASTIKRLEDLGELIEKNKEGEKLMPAKKVEKLVEEIKNSPNLTREIVTIASSFNSNMKVAAETQKFLESIGIKDITRKSFNSLEQDDLLIVPDKTGNLSSMKGQAKSPWRVDALDRNGVMTIRNTSNNDAFSMSESFYNDNISQFGYLDPIESSNAVNTAEFAKHFNNKASQFNNLKRFVLERE